MEKVLNSSLIRNQVPDFVRSEYPKFVTFLEKYYEWLETTDMVSDGLYQIKNSYDIDNADEYYLEQLKRQLLPYFPNEIVADKRLFLKLVAEFYRTNGTQQSIKFLFKALFNENIDIYYPKDDILKTSDGKWVLPLALRIDTADSNIMNIEKTLLTGQTSKATAVVEKVLRSVDRQLGITYTEVYISNITRLFTTGETVTATYNNGTNNVTVSGRLVGALSEIKIDSSNRGLYYNGYDTTTGYSGDPLTIVGGLNPLANNPIGAIAYVGQTTTGGITDIAVDNGGFGFRKQDVSPNSVILDFTGGFEGAAFGTEAKAELLLLDENTPRTINVSNLSIATLNTLYANIAVVENNVIRTISTSTSFNVYPMAFVTLTGSGGGYRNKPILNAYSLYNENKDDTLVSSSVNIVKNTRIITDNTINFGYFFQNGDYVRLFLNNRYEQILVIEDVSTNTLRFADLFPNDISGVSIYKLNRNDLYNIGSIGRINVINGGNGYALNDIIIFQGGSGYGANAVVSQLYTGNNGIKKVTVNNHSSGAYIIGGEGYMRDSLPTLSVQSVSGANASLIVSEVTGDGEQFSLDTSRIGAISSIRVFSYGYDYVSSPTISLRNADIILSNVTTGQLFVSNTVIYQGSSNVSTTFKATVDAFNPATGLLRVFNYRGTVTIGQSLKSDDNSISSIVNSVTYYGDGRAKATAKFENGLIRYPGIYLNTDGQISADKKLQDGEKYHNFSYIIKTKTDYVKFKKPLNDISHPIGTKSFITRIDDNRENINFINSLIDTSSLFPLNYTYSIANGANTIYTSNVSANLAASVNVADFVIVYGVNKRLANTVNVVSGSNVLFGSSNSVNFINDLLEGDTIYLSTGNTVSIKEVSNSYYAVLNTTINVTSTSATINVVYDLIKKVVSVNANTIIVDTNFKQNGSSLLATVQKSR